MHFPIFFWQENIGKCILMVVRVFHRILQSNTLVLSGCGPRHRLRMAHSSSCCGPRHRLRAHCSSSSSGCGPRHRHGSSSGCGPRHRLRAHWLRPAPQAASSLIVLLLGLLVLLLLFGGRLLVVLQQAPALLDQRRKAARHLAREHFVLRRICNDRPNR